jgi:hypothetical protein
MHNPYGIEKKLAELKKALRFDIAMDVLGTIILIVGVCLGYTLCK